MGKEYKYSADYLFKTRGFNKTEENSKERDFFRVIYSNGNDRLIISDKGILYQPADYLTLEFVPLSLLIPICAKLREMEEMYSIPCLAQFGTILDTLGLAENESKPADVTMKDSIRITSSVSSDKQQGKFFYVTIEDRDGDTLGHTITAESSKFDKEEYKKLLIQHIEALI